MYGLYFCLCCMQVLWPLRPTTTTMRKRTRMMSQNQRHRLSTRRRRSPHRGLDVVEDVALMKSVAGSRRERRDLADAVSHVLRAVTVAIAMAGTVTMAVAMERHAPAFLNHSNHRDARRMIGRAHVFPEPPSPPRTKKAEGEGKRGPKGGKGNFKGAKRWKCPLCKTRVAAHQAALEQHQWLNEWCIAHQNWERLTYSQQGEPGAWAKCREKAFHTKCARTSEAVDDGIDLAQWRGNSSAERAGPPHVVRWPSAFAREREVNRGRAIVYDGGTPGGWPSEEKKEEESKERL